MDIKITTRAKVHTRIENGRYTAYDYSTNTDGQFTGGQNRLALKLNIRTGKDFDPNISIEQGNIVTVQRVTRMGEAMAFSASGKRRFSLFSRNEQVVPQTTAQRLGVQDDILFAGLTENGQRVFRGQIILSDGSFATVTPGANTQGEVTIHLMG